MDPEEITASGNERKDHGRSEGTGGYDGMDVGEDPPDSVAVAGNSGCELEMETCRYGWVASSSLVSSTTSANEAPSKSSGK